MNFRTILPIRSTARALPAIAVAVVCVVPVHAHAQNVITDWNNIAITQARASTAPGASAPGGTSLYVAYAQLAVYNAVVAIKGGYEPYKYKVPVLPHASAESAAVESAYRVLVYLLPDRAAQLGAAYTTSMAAIPEGSAKIAGQAMGLFSAHSLLSLRTGDGLGVKWPYSYPSTPEPGVWILTPGATAPSIPWAGQMRPFTFNNPAQYLPQEPPSALTGKKWARDYNEVKTLGAVDSTVRTPAQTEIGLFWTDHTTAQYGGMLQTLATEKNLNLAQTSRLMAMSFTSLADGLIGCFNGKYHYSFWRPVTAIRNGDIDGNPDTLADPAWTPLAVTPAHPEYPAAHACLTGSLADTLEDFFGTPRIHLTVSSAVTGTTHQFSNVRELEEEVKGARIFAGFHYRHSLEQGFELGHKVSRNVTSEYFEPLKKSRW